MLHPRKNITNLLKAFEEFRSNQDSPVKLLIVGHRKWWTAEMEAVYQAMHFRDEVVFTGRLPIEDLAALTASALACTYVSYFEGFGVPIIESMKAGVPVITSNVTSMPEVAAGAALLIDPFNHQSIASAMASIYRDEQLRKRLIEQGLIRSRDFSWEKTANLLWLSIESVLRSR